jgi:hypothetical protein
LATFLAFIFHPFAIPEKISTFTLEFRRHSGGVRKDFTEKGVIEIIFLDDRCNKFPHLYFIQFAFFWELGGTNK